MVQNEPCQLVQKNQGEVPGGGSPPAFGSVSVEAIQETSEIFILTNIDGQILDYQQWLTCNHQWYWAATSCPENFTGGARSPPDE